MLSSLIFASSCSLCEIDIREQLLAMHSPRNAMHHSIVCNGVVRKVWDDVKFGPYDQWTETVTDVALYLENAAAAAASSSASKKRLASPVPAASRAIGARQPAKKHKAMG